MSGNTFGKNFTLTTYGESHNAQIGGIIDGCPAGLVLDFDKIQKDLDRRRPGQSTIVTQRKEQDRVLFHSGIFEGKTTGMPIGFTILNENNKPNDYDNYATVFRPGHADYTYDQKYGTRDYRGGGRSSARETACRVVAGAIAKQIIAPVEIYAFVSSVGPLQFQGNYQEYSFDFIDKNPVRTIDVKLAKEMEHLIKKTKKKGDTIGGVITCVIKNLPLGLGNPVFDRFEAALAHAMLSINASKGFQIGSGFAGTQLYGSQHNDLQNTDGSMKTNYAGGVLGGITTGMDVYFDVAFKPVATLMQPQKMLTKEGKIAVVEGRGRHDACVVPRAVPIVEAMAAMVVADYLPTK